MNTLFFSTKALNKLVAGLLNNDYVTVGFCEEMEIDIVEWYDETFSSIKDATHFEEVIPLLNKHLNVTIKDYKVDEIDGLGEGFLFFI